MSQGVTVKASERRRTKSRASGNNLTAASRKTPYAHLSDLHISLIRIKSKAHCIFFLITVYKKNCASTLRKNINSIQVYFIDMKNHFVFSLTKIVKEIYILLILRASVMKKD